MADIHVKRIGRTFMTLIEDPVLSNNRLFISTVGHDTTTLAPLFQKNFHFTSSDFFRTTVADPSDNNSILKFMPIQLEKGTIQCFAGDHLTLQDNFVTATYHQSLDPEQLPVKRMLKTINNKVVTTMPFSSYPATGAALGSITHQLYLDSDITQGSGSALVSNSTTGPSCYVHEDVNNNRLWGIRGGGGLNQTLAYLNNYESSVDTWVQVTQTNSLAAMVFFVGVDDLGFIHFLSVQDNNTLPSRYTFVKVHPVTAAVTSLISNSTSGNTLRLNPKSWPSNIRRASATRRVIYSSHFDGDVSIGQLAPRRYVFNPADGSVTNTLCTMVYPGTDTFATYAAMYTTTNLSAANNAHSWHMKGHQFTVDGVDYITFWPTDKRAFEGTGLTRWNSEKKRTMMTYTIGSGTDDDVLTYHSSYTFSTQNEIPRDFLPINAAGTQLAVPVTLQMRFFGFNSVTGWNVTGTYPYEFYMVGLDQTNRIWGVSAERGEGVLHFITPTLPLSINVTMASQTFTFTGTDIATSCTVDAFGSDGSRLAAPVNLAIDGNTMVFTSNSTKNIVVNTSDTESITVALTITGGGINNIIASVDI